MKPFSIVLSLILGVASLSLVVWVGRFGAPLPKTHEWENPGKKLPAAPEDVPMPESGPFGKADVSEIEFNFGVKNVGDKDEHVFTIKNVGEGPLKFKLGKPTCQCTIGEITRANGESTDVEPLAPGESASILVKWVMKAQMEKFRQSVPIFTTDPDQRKIELAITGSVDQPLRMIPEGIWQLGDMSTSEPSTAKGYLGSKVLESFTLSEEPRDNPRVKVSWEPAAADILQTHEAKSGYLVKIEVGPDVPIGAFKEPIRLKATAPTGEFSTEFVVMGRRSGPIEIRGAAGAGINVETSRLFFGEFPADKGKHAKVTFIVKDFDQEVVLTSVEPSDTRVKITFPEKGTVLGKSKSYQADFEIPPGPPAKHRREDAEVLTLKFNHPQAPDLKMFIDYTSN